MRETQITIPELALVAGTRAALGAGLGLLLADRLTPEQRRAAGWSLFLVGALSTVPLAFEILGHGPSASADEREQSAKRSSDANRRRQGVLAQPRPRRGAPASS